MGFLSFNTRLAQLLLVILASINVNAVSIERRAVINHDAVVGFSQAVPNTVEGISALKYKPWLEVVNGCVPFPAVDSLGNTGGGLSTSGSPNGGCSSSIGQVYTRSATYNNRFAIMYSWYMPKDSPSSGLGHRHDWEGIVVWLNSPNAAGQQVLAVSTSAHGNFDTFQEPLLSLILDGSRPKIQYFSVWPVNHQLGVTMEKGGEQPLIAWESLTEAARNALSNTDFGSATVPFKDSTFQANLAKASF